MEKISIIIPIYKVDLRYLRTCLNSIKKQKYNNIEIIIVLDGAPSKIIDFCKEYIEENKLKKKTKLVITENKGVACARNKGIETSTGQWITFVDADDWIEENACNLLENTLKKLNRDVDFVMFNGYVNTAKKAKILRIGFKKDCYINKNEIYRLFQSSYGSKYGNYKACESVWKNFFKAEFIKNNKIEFPKNVKVGEDMIFNYNVWKNCKTGYFINKSFYHYRINESSIMNSDYGKLIEKYNGLYPIFIETVKGLKNGLNKNYELFFIRQLERFTFKYFFKKSNNKQGLKELLKNNYYKENIKKSKITELPLKHGIFLFALKIKNYSLLKLLSIIYNKKNI